MDLLIRQRCNRWTMSDKDAAAGLVKHGTHDGKLSCSIKVACALVKQQEI